ncbi:hypothetical protein ACF0H5_022547 [Mactra antiquata]
MYIEQQKRNPFQCYQAIVCRLLIIVYLATEVTSYETGSRFVGRVEQLYKNPFYDKQFSDSDGEVFDDGSKKSDPLDPHLKATFNYRVQSPSQLCPKKFAVLYLLTKDVKYLKDCGNYLGITERNSTANPAMEAQPIAKPSYSGKLLKRILQNMDAGTIKTDFLPSASSYSKRARLSVNSALSSLAGLLRNENMGHREPKYAFHREMLKMG